MTYNFRDLEVRNLRRVGAHSGREGASGSLLWSLRAAENRTNVTSAYLTYLLLVFNTTSTYTPRYIHKSKFRRDVRDQPLKAMNTQRTAWRLLRGIATTRRRNFSQFPGHGDRDFAPRASIPMPYITEVTVCSSQPGPALVTR